MAAKEFQNIIDETVDCEIEPAAGASSETMLVTTNSYEEYEQDMINRKDDKQIKDRSLSKVEKIQEDVKDTSRINQSTNSIHFDQVPSLDYSEVVRIYHFNCYCFLFHLVYLLSLSHKILFLSICF